jgi:hypothetical protein
LIQINAPIDRSGEGAPPRMEQPMTTGQSYFLILAIATFSAVGLSMAISTVSYRRWLRRQPPGRNL